MELKRFSRSTCYDERARKAPEHSVPCHSTLGRRCCSCLPDGPCVLGTRCRSVRGPTSSGARGETSFTGKCSRGSGRTKHCGQQRQSAAYRNRRIFTAIDRRLLLVEFGRRAIVDYWRTPGSGPSWCCRPERQISQLL